MLKMLEEIFLQYGAMGLLAYMIYWQTQKFSKILNQNTKTMERANFIIAEWISKFQK